MAFFSFIAFFNHNQILEWNDKPQTNKQSFQNGFHCLHFALNNENGIQSIFVGQLIILLKRINRHTMDSTYLPLCTLN